MPSCSTLTIPIAVPRVYPIANLRAGADCSVNANLRNAPRCEEASRQNQGKGQRGSGNEGHGDIRPVRVHGRRLDRYGEGLKNASGMRQDDPRTRRRGRERPQYPATLRVNNPMGSRVIPLQREHSVGLDVRPRCLILTKQRGPPCV
jgi:hypothetical protein